MIVKAVDANVEERSRAQVEEALLKEQEDKYTNSSDSSDDSDSPDATNSSDGIDRIDFSNKQNSSTTDASVDESEAGENKKDETSAPEFSDDDVLSYIKKRYDKNINSIDELFAEKEANIELPEDVSKYLKYKQETGRGINDFYELQKDIDSMDDNAVLANYYESTEKGLDPEDIQDIIEDKFSYDEDLDDEKDVRKIKLAKKRELAKAKTFLNEQKDKYKIPLESSGNGLSGDFNNEFKGFDFSVGEKNITFKSGDASELKNVQSDVNNFINKFMDKDGLIEDAKGYHKALSVAMNPDKFAKHFYDQGVASALDNSNRKSKNINMDVRQQSQTVSKNGISIRPVNQSNDNGRGLKIRSVKKK